MKKKLNKKRILIVSSIVLILVLAIIILIVLKNHDENNNKSEMTLNFESRVQALNDLVEADVNKFGWLQVQGTNVDVPILTITNVLDDYSHGWVSGNSIGMKTRTVLIGHNVLNVSSSPMVNNSILTDFEDLMAFVYHDFAKENMYISFTTGGVSKTYVIYAIGFYDYGYDNAEGLNNDDEIEKYIDGVRENSIYTYDVDVNKNDDLLTVKTCTRYFGASEKQQFVIDARLLRSDEVPLKYNVKKTKLYNEYGLVDSYKKDGEV